jgi:hypothetical protein
VGVSGRGQAGQAEIPVGKEAKLPGFGAETDFENSMISWIDAETTNLAVQNPD